MCSAHLTLHKHHFFFTRLPKHWFSQSKWPICFDTVEQTLILAFVFLYTDVTIGFNMSSGNSRRFSQNPSIIVQVTDKKKKKERKEMVKKQNKTKKQLWSRPSVWLLCVNSSTDQWASLSCESVSSKRVSCFLNSSSMQQLCHTWLRCFRQPQRSITTAKSLMSFCTALEYLIPQAALPCIYVNSEHPQSSGELNKKGQGPEKFLYFYFIFFVASLRLTFLYGGKFEEVMCLNYLTHDSFDPRRTETLFAS